MPPPKQSGLVPVIVDVGVAGGLEAKLDRKLTQPPFTTVAKNVRYPTVGSVRKRHGIQFVTQPSPGNTTMSIGNTNDELLATDKSFLYSYSPESDRWSRKGVCPQVAIGTSAVGSYQLPAPFAGSAAQVRGLTYEVIDGIGLAAYDTGDNLDVNNIATLGTIQLALFDTTTGKTLWTTAISSAFRTGGTMYDCLGSGAQTPSASGGDKGVAYPVIRTYKGQFYLLFLGCFAGNFNNTPGYFYPLNLYRMGTPVSLAATVPSISASSYTGCTRMSFGNTPAMFRNTFGYTSPTGPLVNYDMAQNTDSLMLIASAQSTGTGANTAGVQAFTLLNSSSTSLTLIQASVLPTGMGTGPITLSASPPNADGTVPGNAIYCASTTTGAISYRAPGAQSVNGAALQTVLYDAPALAYSQPIACKVIGNGTTFELYATDGIAYKHLNVSSISGAFTNAGSGAITVDYACNFALASVSSQNTAPWLQSRIFTAPDGQLVVWVMVQLYSNKNNFTCLVLVPVGSSVVPQNSVYAHAFYYRAGCALRGMQACNVVNGSVLAYQLMDIPNRIAAIQQISIASKPYPSICRLKQGAIITGGDTKYYDGSTVRTMGWLKSPEVPQMLSGTAPVNYIPINQGSLITVTAPNSGPSVVTGQTYAGYPKGTNPLPLTTGVANGGTLDPTFPYSYIFVWVDYDAYGNAIYSSPSDVVYVNGVQNTQAGSYSTVVTGTVSFGENRYQVNSTVTLAQMPYLPMQYRDIMNPTRGQCLVYRNSSKAPSLYRRIAPLTYCPPATYTVSTSPYLVDTGTTPNNVYSINSVTGTISRAEGYYDFSPDDNLSAPQVYVQPITGAPELPNDPPPPSTFAVNTVRRPLVSSAENRTWLYYGKPYFPGRAPEFCAAQFLEIDPASGDITQLAVLDQNVIIFKRERIFVLTGDGPDATGSGVFNNTYAVATDTGCCDSGSVISTEAGVFFRSVRGIQIIDRSLTVTYIGAQVERIVNGSTVASAALVPAQNQIRWALSSNDPAIQGTAADNVVLVYDYFLKKWSTYGFQPGYDPQFSLKLIGQATWRDNWFGLAGGAVFQDAGPENTYLGSDRIKWTDGPNQVAMDVQTGWVPLNGVQGWGRLRRVNVLGDFEDNHTLTLQIAYDYDDTWVHTIPFSPANTVNGSPQNWRVRAPRQVAESVKFRLIDDGTGEACVITGLQLETSKKRGALNVPIQRSV